MEFHKEHGDRFTERVRKVLSLAQEEAQRQQKSAVETEHILLALLHEGKGVAARVLGNRGLHLQDLRATVAGLQAPASEANPPQAPTPETDPTQAPTPGNTSPSEKPNLAPEAETTLHFAIVEASRLNHRYIGTEHLLLALMQQPESLASKALQAHNIRPESIRTDIIQMLSLSSSMRRSGPQQSQAEQNRNRFDRFTERARKVLSLAQEEAQRFQHNYIGTEHLLLGLAREKEGVAAQALDNMNISLAKVREAVEFIIGRGDRIILGEIGLTPRAKKVIELAVDEARILNHHYIGTEHLLLGLVREGEGIAAGVLESLGVKLKALRTSILIILKQEGVLETEEDLTPDEGQQIFHTTDNYHVTQQLMEAVQFAHSERIRLQHPTLGTEHVLLGLLYDEQSVTAGVLQELGVDFPTLYPAIEALQERDELPYPWLSAYTPLVKALQDVAGHEATRLKSTASGNEHLLLAILHFPESNAVKILQQLGADSATIRSKLLERLQQA